MTMRIRARQAFSLRFAHEIARSPRIAILQIGYIVEHLQKVELIRKATRISALAIYLDAENIPRIPLIKAGVAAVSVWK